MELIDIRQLRAFRILAETGSFTTAAQRLYLTQSAVSHSIKALEKGLECALFDRRGKKVTLTAAGDALLKRANRILREMQLAVSEVTPAHSYGRLRIGATDTACQYILPLVLREFLESFPRCEVTVKPGDTVDLLGLLGRSEIDVGIGINSQKESSFDFHPLFEDEMGFVFCPVHPWAERTELSPEDIAGSNFIIYANQSQTYRLIEDHFAHRGVRIPSFLELGNMEAIKEFARIGMGIGIVAPWIALAELNNRTLIFRPMGDPPITRQWGLFLRKGRTVDIRTHTFAGICRSVVRQFRQRPRDSGCTPGDSPGG